MPSLLIVATPGTQRDRNRPLADPPRDDDQRSVDASASEDLQRLLEP